MNNQLIIYYSVENCGDGSAYQRLFDTEELAEWHQNHLDESWGESCTGNIVIEGDNLRCSELHTKEVYYLDLLFENDDNLNLFVSKFFPDGLPEFIVEIINPHCYGFFVKGRLIYRSHVYGHKKKANDEGVKRLTTIINQM